MDQQLLIKFAQTPGYCCEQEIDDVLEWLVEFRHKLSVYRSALGEPVGLSVDSHIDKANWYRNRFSGD